MPKKRKPSGRGYQSRRVGTREPLQRFLLVCEGEKTEPAYFYGFRMPTVKIEIVGLGKDPVALIDRAVDQRGKGEYDQVWCVFDRDDVPAERFNQARALARRKTSRWLILTRRLSCGICCISIIAMSPKPVVITWMASVVSLDGRIKKTITPCIRNYCPDRRSRFKMRGVYLSSIIPQIRPLMILRPQFIYWCRS